MHWCWVMCVEKKELGEHWRNCGSVMFVIACLNCCVMLLLVVKSLFVWLSAIEIYIAACRSSKRSMAAERRLGGCSKRVSVCLPPRQQKIVAQ